MTVRCFELPGGKGTCWSHLILALAHCLAQKVAAKEPTILWQFISNGLTFFAQAGLFVYFLSVKQCLTPLGYCAPPLNRTMLGIKSKLFQNELIINELDRSVFALQLC